jgi:hypothetical protein
MRNVPKTAMKGVDPYTKGWDHFDSLPREYKELAWEGPRCFIPMLTSIPVETMKRQMEELYAKDTLKVYGPNHPQAFR